MRLALASILVAVATPAFAGAPAAAGAKWEIDSAHTAAQFSVKHLMVSTVRGQLGKVTGTITTAASAKDFAGAQIDVTIDASGINTREEKRDAHLKSPDFFDVAKFPSLTYKSKKVEKVGAKYKVTGDLTLHGVTKEVVLDVEMTPEQKDPWGGAAVGAAATGKINRKDYGLSWNKPLEAGGVLVSDEVNIQIDVELKKAK